MYNNGFDELNREITEIELVWRQYLQDTHVRIQRVVRNSRGIVEIPREEYQTYLRLLIQAIRMTNTGQWIALNREFSIQMGEAVTNFCNAVEERTAATQQELERLAALILSPDNLEASLRAGLEQAAEEARARLNKQE